MNPRTKAIPGILMAAALVIMTYKDYFTREADAIATRILTQAESNAKKDLKTCVETSKAQVQNQAGAIKRCQQTLAGQAAYTCSEIMGRLATEAPQTFEICQNVYKNSLNAGTKAIQNL